MKKSLFGHTLAMLLIVGNLFGQHNNPKNQLGVDVANAFYVISNDLQEGKIKDISQSTLDQYFKNLLPAYPEIKLDEFNQIFQNLKNSDNKTIIANSGISEEAKQFLEKSLTDYSITKLVDEVRASKIQDSEKEEILSVLAVNYNLITAKDSGTGIFRSTGKGPNSDYISEKTMLRPDLLQKGTTLIWGALGFVTGSSICGLPCGIIGGVIGLVLGGYSSSQGSGSAGSGGWHPQP